ncbi:DUF1854 domain-containing protein [Armatimonas rosea]|uniref:DUF1854 domain-containing protein n=1 Tax=Armatimonas rosea TaxID=685828 RepID=A0A7W9SVZ4_ARMRO|nr:DUF1854 domain-containing protein [Armatimonas rosea]MBB6052934.1 hypothetical protein [Armatimonas rosea]
MEPNANTDFDLIFLDPKTVTLFRTGGSAVRATIADPRIGYERTYLICQIARAFPLSLQDQYIGLRDAKDKDIGMLETLKGLDESSRAIVDEELERRYFVPTIRKVTKVKKEYDTVNFEVETDKGERKFSVQNLKDSIQEVGGGRILLTDRTGSRYNIPDVMKLDEKTFAILSRVL